MAVLRRDVPVLTVVTPVYNEIGILEQYYREVSRTLLSRTDIEARVLFVDDGSSDGSWAKLEEFAGRSDRFSALRLSRNFGAHVALTAAMDHVPSSADIVATLACDLQDPPETIIDFVSEWRKGSDVVWGARKSRSDAGWRQVASKALEALLRRYAMPRNSKFQTGSFLLIDRRVVDAFCRFREHARSTFAIVAWTGFDQAVVYYDRRPRSSGRSGWSFGKMLNSAYDVFMSFSLMPAKMFAAFGIFMSVLSFAGDVYLFVDWAFHNVQPGWTGLIGTMTLCFGILFVMMGFMFEYLSRIFVEAKSRPLYFVARSVGAVEFK